MRVKKFETLMIDLADVDDEFDLPKNLAERDPREKLDMLAYYIRHLYFEYRKVIGEYYVNSFHNRRGGELPFKVKLNLFLLIAKNDLDTPIPNETLKKICIEALNKAK